MRESEIQAAIMDYLRIRGVFAWRSNTGAGKLTHANGSSRFVRFGFAGCADILGCLDDGRFLAIEVKNEGGRLSKDQDVFLEAIRRRGGIAFVARSVEDVIQVLREAS